MGWQRYFSVSLHVKRSCSCLTTRGSMGPGSPKSWHFISTVRICFLQEDFWLLVQTNRILIKNQRRCCRCARKAMKQEFQEIESPQELRPDPSVLESNQEVRVGNDCFPILCASLGLPTLCVTHHRNPFVMYLSSSTSMQLWKGEIKRKTLRNAECSTYEVECLALQAGV